MMSFEMAQRDVLTFNKQQLFLGNETIVLYQRPSGKPHSHTTTCNPHQSTTDHTQNTVSGRDTKKSKKVELPRAAEMRVHPWLAFTNRNLKSSAWRNSPQYQYRKTPETPKVERGRRKNEANAEEKGPQSLVIE